MNAWVSQPYRPALSIDTSKIIDATAVQILRDQFDAGWRIR